jgi:hypothetical protein
MDRFTLVQGQCIPNLGLELDPAGYWMAYEDHAEEVERLCAELAACMVLLDQAYKALKYHREQTRPIHETDEVIAAIDAARKGEGENNE